MAKSEAKKFTGGVICRWMNMFSGGFAPLSFIVMVGVTLTMPARDLSSFSDGARVN
jgi:hypothetical protein